MPRTAKPASANCRRRGPGQAEAERRPEERRERRSTRAPRCGSRDRRRRQRGDECRAGPAPRPPRPARAGHGSCTEPAYAEHERRHEEHAEDVADPPAPPDARVLGPTTVPAAQALAVPIVALSVVLASRPARSTPACRGRRSSSPGARPKRRTRRAPATASSVLPAEMPSAASTGTSADALTAKAPSATAGQSESPAEQQRGQRDPRGAHTAAAIAAHGVEAQPEPSHGEVGSEDEYRIRRGTS